MVQHSLKETENQLFLTGSEEIEIQILKGGQCIEESIRKLLREKKILLPDEDYVWKKFVGARWVFYPNGQFFFIPSPTVDFDTKLLPLSGTYLKVEDTFKFQGERQSAEGGIACVDGIIHTNGNIFRAEFIYSRNKASEKILQVLSQNAQPPSIQIETIEGIEVPSTFNIFLEGKTEAQSFGPLSGTLQILPCHPNDPNPFFVKLHTENNNVNGRFLWSSFSDSSIEEGTANGAIALNNGQVCIEFQPIAIRELRVGLTWDTLNQGEMAEYLPTVGVDVNQGTLTFVIQGDRVSGSIRASGTVFSLLSTGSVSSTYEAEFTGQRQVDNLELAETLLLLVEPQTENAFAEAESFEENEIPINSVFNVSITGRTEAQSFNPLTGKLMLLSNSDPEDPNLFFVSLHIDAGLHITNGFIHWITYNDVGEHKQLESRVFVENGQIRLEVEPSQNLRTLIWYTLPKDMTSDVALVPVHVERGNFIFSIKGNKISGEIHASGTTFESKREFSTYDAHIEGQKQVSLVAEEIRRTLNSPGFAGCWETKNHFEQIELQESGHKVSGTYTGRGGGIIEGIVRGSRLDFTWKDEQAEGWGFFRAIFSQGTLTGLCVCVTDKTKIQSLIGTRQYPTLLTNQDLTADDAQELKYLAQNLWQQGRGELAIPLLEKVLNFYKSERLKPQTQDTDNFLTTEVEVLNLLIHCEAQSNNFERLPERLVYALAIQQLQDPRRLLKQYFNNKIDDLIKLFNQTLKQLKSLQSNLSQLQTVNQERIEIIEAFTLLTEQWEWLQNRINHDCSELNNLKISVTNSKIAYDSVTWLNFGNFIAEKQKFFLSEQYKVTERKMKVFKDQIEIIHDLNIWLRRCNYENLKNPTINDLYKLDEIENGIKQLVIKNSKLTNFEKQLFMNQFSLIMILLLMTNSLKNWEMKIRNYTGQIEEEFRLTETINSHNRSLANLSTHMESWRKELVRDIDKIEALGKGQLFFQELVKILFELGSYKQALVVSETAKTRAFADLLATRSDIQERMRQISSKERVIFNIATAPSLTFEDILEIVQHQ